jgi:nucleoside-diphosphate-sugar epimerase
VLAKFITQMQLGESPTIFGDGEQSRDFTFVANAVQANLKACVAPAEEVSGRVFNIATGTRFSLNQIFEMLGRIIGFNGPAKYAEPRTGDVKHSLADITLAKKHLGYSPDVGFEEGLRRTVAWYEEQRAVKPSSGVLAGQR